MNVEYSGWSAEHGHFFCNIFINEKKTDYEIIFGDGHKARQSSPFKDERADWNNDGDVYTQYGAWFDHVDENGRFKGGEFWTPEQMVRAVADAQEKERFFAHEVVRIPGIVIPFPEKRPSLEQHLEHLAREERRKDAQSIERNRKMHALGIRQPGDPWAR